MPGQCLIPKRSSINVGWVEMWKEPLASTISLFFLLHCKGCQICLQATLFGPLYSLFYTSKFIGSFIILHKLYICENVIFTLKFSKYGFSSISRNSHSVIFFFSGQYFVSPLSPSLNYIHPYALYQAVKQKRKKGLYFPIFPTSLPLALIEILGPLLAKTDSGKKCSNFPALNFKLHNRGSISFYPHFIKTWLLLQGHIIPML